MTWEKLPPIDGGSKGCLCCGSMHQSLSADSVIAVGFGAATVSRDGLPVYDEQEVEDEQFWTCADADKSAAADPDHDWRISYFAPLYEAIYQRQGEGHWVLVQKGEGFA